MGHFKAHQHISGIGRHGNSTAEVHLVTLMGIKKPGYLIVH